MTPPPSSSLSTYQCFLIFIIIFKKARLLFHDLDILYDTKLVVRLAIVGK